MVVLGLGNPGDEYADTRHNCGFKVVDYLGEKTGIELKKKFFKKYMQKNSARKLPNGRRPRQLGTRLMLKSPLRSTNGSRARVSRLISPSSTLRKVLLLALRAVQFSATSQKITTTSSAAPLTFRTPITRRLSSTRRASSVLTTSRVHLSRSALQNSRWVQSPTVSHSTAASIRFVLRSSCSVTL